MAKYVIGVRNVLGNASGNERSKNSALLLEVLDGAEVYDPPYKMAFEIPTTKF